MRVSRPRFRGWSLVSGVFRSPPSRRRPAARRRSGGGDSLERLEDRRLLAFDLVAAFVQPDEPFFITSVTTEQPVLDRAPQQITLRFSPGAVIDPASLGGITVLRSGRGGDPFGPGGEFPDVPVALGSITVNDVPNQNEVVLRFAETLPDDTFRITIQGDDPAVPGYQGLVSAPPAPAVGGAFRNGGTYAFDVRLDRGAQVVSVVPQPVIRETTIEFLEVPADGDLLTVSIRGTRMVLEFQAQSHPAHVPVLVAGPATVSAYVDAVMAVLAPAGVPAAAFGGELAAATRTGSTITLGGSFFTPAVTATRSGAAVSPGVLAIGDGRLVQRRDTVVVHFNANDPLHRSAAENTAFYQLFDTDPATAASGSVVTPLSVSYDAASATAVLGFAAGAIADGRLYRLQVGGSSDANDTRETATDVGTIFARPGGGAAFTATMRIGDGAAGANDVDLFRVRLTAGATMTVTATPGPQLDPALRLFAGDGSPIDAGVTVDGTGAGVVTTLTFTAAADGEFLVGVSSAGNVAYSAVDGTGATGATGGTGSVTLQITSSDQAPLPPDGFSSFDTAAQLGTLGVGGVVVSGTISPLASIPTPFGELGFPSQLGSLDEPGHRDIPYDGPHGDPGVTIGPAGPITTRFYNFQDIIGANPTTGEPYFNLITEAQKQRAREIFELFSLSTGVRFVETASLGTIIATGDLRAADPNRPPDGGIAGLGGPGMAIMSSHIDWGQSLYGGGWFTVAMHEIGHSLGLMHSYDVPSIMGRPLSSEGVFPGDYDSLHLRRFFPANGGDLDVYRFDVVTPGRLAAETFVARPGEAITSTLDTVLTLYREETVGGATTRTLVARNDDSYGRDSFIGLEVTPGTYFIVVTSTGNTAFDPTVEDSGYGGRSDGAYELRLGFTPIDTPASTIVDTTGRLLDGNRDGRAGGSLDFWFHTAAAADTLVVDKAAPAGGDGSLAAPFRTIEAAVSAASAGASLIRIVGNSADLPYLVGLDLEQQALEDGGTFNVPAGVTVMIDAGAILKLRDAIIDVGSSSELVPRGGAALQVLGTPDRPVVFTSYHDDTVGGDADGAGPSPRGGQWGGIVFRADSDVPSRQSFVNTVQQARLHYGGGQVLVDNELRLFAPIQIEATRPSVVFNTITDSGGAAIAATPNSFLDTGDRIGPEFRGNVLRDNTTNGLFIKIDTRLGEPTEKLSVPARWTSTDIVHVLQENLFIAGGAGGYEQRVDPADGVVKNFARATGRLTIDPGVIVKLQGSRIELERGGARLFAEGLPGSRVIFTSLADNRYGAGGTFDTNGNLPNAFDPFGRPLDLATGAAVATPAGGQWGGIMVNQAGRASIDYAYLAFGGGQTTIEGGFASFNVVETHQGELRVANSRIEFNASGHATTNPDRVGRGTNAPATIFVRGAQPVILDNDFRANAGAVVNVNANSLSDVPRPDPGRATGIFAVAPQFGTAPTRHGDNVGPLVRGNRLQGLPGVAATLGMVVRGEEITVESVWDDVDIVHVLRDEILVQNFHTATGVRLLSRPAASLVVKLEGPAAGFTAAGYGLDIDDRIGGTVQVIGQPGAPVILTSLRDDSVGASLDPLGRFVTDTNNDGTATLAAPGDWRSLQFLEMSNDRNVAVIIEREGPATGGIDVNRLPNTAQRLGVLAPNHPTGTNSWESAQEKSGDENRRLGFEVHGFISLDDPTDVDVYSFVGYAGSEVWIDLDKTGPAVDLMVELLNANGTVVFARSVDAQTDAALSAATRGSGLSLEKDAWRGGDHFTLNPKDPGMRVVLPGTQGTAQTYLVRVRSQPRAVPGSAATDYEAMLRDSSPAGLAAGVTSGRYELRIRLRQQDEKPGSTVRHADIRYPTIGIDVRGLPRNSPLVGETGEHPTAAGAADDNGTFAQAQYVGRLLQADRNTISVAGTIGNAADVDWYSFTLNLAEVQFIGGVTGASTWPVVFDVDYADGGRGDLTISVFDAAGTLIYVGRDSNIEDDRAAPGQGADLDDLSRGSLGPRDPFIGPVHLPAGGPLPDNPEVRYFVAISSNAWMPTAVTASLLGSEANRLVRLEPVNSITRVVEDHIGFVGYTDAEGGAVSPTAGPLVDTTSVATLAANVRPFALADVTLFVTNGGGLFTVDAFSGGIVTTIAPTIGSGIAIGDLDMRPDGRLYAYAGIANDAANVGRLLELDTGTGAIIASSNDGIANKAAANPLNWQTTSDAVLATAFRRTAVGVYDEVWLVVRSGAASKLYRGASGGTAAAGGAVATANQTFDNASGLGYRGTIQVGEADVLVTGIQFAQDSVEPLLGVTSDGRFLTIGTGLKQGTADTDPEYAFEATLRADFAADLATFGATGFTGLAAAPQNLEGSRFRGMFFAMTDVGRLVVIDPAGDALLADVFDTTGDGEADSWFSNPVGVANPTGLAFSPLDVNLWHPTSFRHDEPGHGVTRAADESRTPGDFRSESIFGQSRGSSEALGGASMHFGLEQWQPNPAASNRYFVAPGSDGQFGVVAGAAYAWQRELTLNPAVGDTYNLPGGAHGSLITNPFSLAGSTYADKPTLYFNYWLETQAAAGKADQMRDSARVLASVDGGTTWQLLATNNSARSAVGTTDGELPSFASVSSSVAITATLPNQHVQELYDTAGWRQVRIDLGKWAGEADIRLRFDFHTAGEFNAAQLGILPDGSVGLVNAIDGLANTTGNLGSPTRGQNNQFGGFFIDDIIVGFAERGEMVTGAGATDQQFVLINTPTGTNGVPTQNLTGPYQLEIRRGTEYGAMGPNGLAITTTFAPDTRFIRAAGLRGDENLPREQGQFIIENNLVSDALAYGISIDAGMREADSNAPRPGVVRNFPTLNNSRLVPGAFVVNNIVAGSGIAGILFSGDPNTGAVPTAAVPHGRIVNNTIYGGPTPQGTGIVVSDNAGPTLLNNLFANLATGVAVDASSRTGAGGTELTVIGYSAYFNTSTQVSPGMSQSFPLLLDTDPFVNASQRNFYLAAGSRAIDSAIDSLQDRSDFVNVKAQLLIPQSPVAAPERDLFGQLRQDDPGVAALPGLGANVFKDRGAVDRVDFTAPTATLAVPADNAAGGLVDRDPRPHRVRLHEAQARGLSRFVLQLGDVGVGIDRTTVAASAFSLAYVPVIPVAAWSGVPPLVEGADYRLTYLPASNELVFESNSVFGLGEYRITVDNSAVSGIRDLAGNRLLNNDVAGPGTTAFSITLVDVPAAPTAVQGGVDDSRVTLSWTAPTAATGATLSGYLVQWSADGGGTWTAFNALPLAATTATVTGLSNGTTYRFRVAAVNDSGIVTANGTGVGPYSAPIAVTPLATPGVMLASDNGAASDDGVTNDPGVTIGGLEAAATWEYRILGGGWTAGSGSSLTLPEGVFAPGEIEVRQTFPVGTTNTSRIGVNTLPFVIDLSPPDAVGLALGADVTDPVSLGEAVSAGGVVAVAGETGATIVVTFRDAASATVTKTVVGTGSVQPVVLDGADLAVLADGVIEVSAVQTDLAGNPQTGPATTLSFTLDTIPPTGAATLALGAGITDPVSAGEAVAAGGVVATSAEAGNLVVVTFVGPAHTVTKTLTADGGVQPVILTAGDLTTLGDGVVTVTATQTDLAGNPQIDPPATLSFTLDTVPPAAPGLVLGAGVAAGATAAEATQPSGVVVVEGELDAAIVVMFTRGANVIAKTLVGTGGPQPVVLTAGDLAALGDGVVTVSATQTDRAGNPQTAPAATATFTLDTVSPAAPGLVLGAGVADGATAAEATQPSGVVVVEGELDAAIVVTFTRGANSVAKTLVGTGGPQPVVLTTGDLAALGDGVVAVTATQTDRAGNPQTAPATAVTFTLDTVPPVAPSFALAADTGTSATDGITADGRIAVVGLEPTGTWEYSTDGGTSWTAGQGTVFTLPEGTYPAGGIRVRQTDAAGNVSPVAQSGFVIVVDTTPPLAPAVTLANDTGESPTDGITNDGRLTIGGVEPAGRWESSIDGGLTWTTGAGTTRLVPPGIFPAGTVLVRQIDLAGNLSPPRSAPALTVDVAAPTITGFSAPSGAYPIGGTIPITATLSEIVQAGGTVQVTLNTGAVVTLTAVSRGSSVSGSYVVSPGEATDRLRVTAITPTGSLRDIAGNPLVDTALPPSASLPGPIAVAGAVRVLGAPPTFSTDPTQVADAGISVRTIPIRFSTPVTGVTTAAFELFLDGRSVSLSGAQLSGSGADYVLTLPEGRANPSGFYTLVVRSTAGIRATANGAAMAEDSRLFWGRDRSGAIPTLPASGRPAVDLDGNGVADVLWVSTGGEVIAWLDGNPNTSRTLGGGGGWTLGATGDFNADGVSDLVWRNPDGIYVVWLMNSGGATIDQRYLGGGGGWELEATGDYDGDGRTDLVWRNSVNGANVMWLMNGVTPTSQTVVGGNLDWRLVSTDERFDANADGKTDLIWRHAASGVNVLWRMNGSSVISTRSLGGDASWRIAGTGDFDGDGKGDVLWRDAASGSVIMQLLDDGAVKSQGFIGGDAASTVAVTMDADGDGKADIYWRNLGSGATERWLMNGTTVRSKTPIGGNAVWRLLGRPGTNG